MPHSASQSGGVVLLVDVEVDVLVVDSDVDVLLEVLVLVVDSEVDVLVDVLVLLLELVVVGSTQRQLTQASGPQAPTKAPTSESHVSPHASSI